MPGINRLRKLGIAALTGCHGFSRTRAGQAPARAHGFGRTRGTQIALGRTCWVAALALALIVAGRTAGAQDQEDPEPEEAAAAPNVAMFDLNENQFDAWVFGGMNMNGNNSYQKKLDTQLSLQIEQADRTCTLTDAQKKKLKLAGLSDAKRFLDKVDEKRRKYLNTKVEQAKIGEIYQELQPLSVLFNSGLFGVDSLYAKTFKSTLAPEQAQRYEQITRDRTSFRYKAAVDLVVSRLSALMGLTDEQGRKLSRLIVEETRPPRSLGRQEFYAIMHHAAMVPQEKYKEILDEPQMRVLNRQLQRMRGLEQFLKGQGYVPDDTPVEPKAPKVGR
jgi:hypothetical protein